MQVGDLVKHARGMLGIIVEIPTEDDYWGKTAVIQWADGPMGQAWKQLYVMRLQEKRLERFPVRDLIMNLY